MRETANSVARRVKQIRREVFGEDGIPAIAEAMRLPARTWEHYEAGVTIPATVLLVFIDITGSDTHWLLTGAGERYRPRPDVRLYACPGLEFR